MTTALTPPARMFTSFGTVLYVDPNSGELRHGEPGAVPANVVLIPVAGPGPTNLRGRLVYRDNGCEHPVVCSPEGSAAVVSDDAAGQGDAGTVFDVVQLGRGIVGLWSRSLFLMAEPDGRLLHSRPVCSTWECFIPSEDWSVANDPALRGQQPTAPIARARIRELVIEPRLRLKLASRSAHLRVVVYGYPKWSHGRVYYDVAKNLYPFGYAMDLLNWQQDHSSYIDDVKNYYDFFMTSPDGVQTLFERYNVPYKKMIVISHHEFDVRMLIEQKGIEVFDEFAAYGVVSYFVYCASMIQGVRRPPMVVSLGVEFDDFYTDLPTELETVGYASSMSNETFGVEWKRGHLAAAAARNAGLAFSIAGSTGAQTSFHEMPLFYRSVQAVLTSSLSEAAQLPVMEAAAAGRLVISTPVGHFPLKAYQGGGVIAPIEPEKFVAFSAATLKHYKENPGEFVDKCASIQQAARQFDWRYAIGDWVELMQSASLTL